MSGADMNCTLFDDQGKCTAVVAVRKFMASFSLLGCVFMMAVIWLFSKYKVFVQRLVLYLTIAAFLASIGFLMASIKSEGPVCSLEGFWLTFSNWAVLLWVLIITINLYLNAVKRMETEKYEILYSCIAWLVPFFVACLPLIGHRYGPAGAWCWIQKEEDGWRFGIWYIPLFVIIAVMFILYLTIIYQVNREGGRWFGTYNPDNDRHRRMLQVYVKPLRVYPIIFFVLVIFPLINRLQNAISLSGEPVFVLSLLHASTSALQGFVNAIVFGLDPETRRRLTWHELRAAVTKKRSRTVIKEYSGSSTAVVTNTDPAPVDSQECTPRPHNVCIVSEEYRKETGSWYLGEVPD